MSPESWLADAALQRGIHLSLEQVKQLVRFGERVCGEAVAWGLSGRKNLESVLALDILDSLLLIPHVPHAGFLLDIGSGAGFPGIPVSIGLPSLAVTLLEGRKKALQFLANARKSLGFSLDIIDGRAEELKKTSRFLEKFDCVTGRAVAPLARFVPWAADYLKPGGTLILQKGKKWESELEEGRKTLKKHRLAVVGFFPGLTGDQKVVALEKLRR